MDDLPFQIIHGLYPLLHIWTAGDLIAAGGNCTRQSCARREDVKRRDRPAEGVGRGSTVERGCRERPNYDRCAKTVGERRQRWYSTRRGFRRQKQVLFTPTVALYHNANSCAVAASLVSSSRTDAPSPQIGRA